MDDPFEAAPLPARVLRLVGLGAAGVAVAGAVGVGALLLWLRTDSPLRAAASGYAPGPGIAAVIQPAVGSHGRAVFFPAYRAGRPFDVAFTLRNAGRLSVTVESLEPAAAGRAPWLGAVGLRTALTLSPDAASARSRPFEPLVLRPGETAVLVASFRLACPTGGGRVPSVFADSLRLRFRALRWFERAQSVALPFAVTLRCVGGPPEQP